MSSGIVNAEARSSEKLYDLEALPGAWVKIRRFDHGEMIDRMGKIIVVGVGARKDGGESGDARIDHRASRIHDFAKAIIDHNLGDKKGNKYDFSKPKDVFAIDPTVGDEIADKIGEHQEAIPEEEVPNSEGS